MFCASTHLCTLKRGFGRQGTSGKLKLAEQSISVFWERRQTTFSGALASHEPLFFPSSSERLRLFRLWRHSKGAVNNVRRRRMSPNMATEACSSTYTLSMPSFSNSNIRKKRNNPHQAPKYAQVPMVAVFAFFAALEFGFSGEDYTSQFREIHAIVMFIKF